jgi:hypothetical protein
LASTPSAPDQVRIWASQLAANDFPPICAMTGAPAETWRKFRFATAPGWAYVFLILLCTGIGLLPIFIIMAVVSRRASGYLPLTKASSRKLNLVLWSVVGLLVLTPLLWLTAAIFGSGTNDQTGSSVAGFGFVLGILTFFAFIVAALVVRPLVGPRGKVMEQQPGYYDKLVELRKVHHNFVTAVNQVHQARATQYVSMQARPDLPPPPGST